MTTTRTRTSRARRGGAGLLALALVGLLAVSAGAHREPVYFWKYDPVLFRESHDWKGHEDLVARHKGWHHRHPKYRDPAHRRFHHKLVHAHMALHYHEVLGVQEGQATWYDLRGQTGACGEPLKGLYAAHPTWKCGTLVSVRAGDRYVHVTVQDRGPFGEGRVIDLSKEAFTRVADPSDGVVDVTIYRLAPPGS